MTASNGRWFSIGWIAGIRWWLPVWGLLLAGCAGEAPQAPLSTAEIARRHMPIRTYANSSTIRLNWPRMRRAASYTLYWSYDPDVASERDNRIAGIKGTGYFHKNLEKGRTYYYFVEALNSKNEVIHNYRPIGDIPFTYPVRRHGNFLSVVPRVHDTFASLASQHLKDRRKGWVIREFNAVSAVTPFKPLLIPLKPVMPGGIGHKGYRMVSILTYHHLSHTRANKTTVRLSDFIQQMAYLKLNRYRVITLDQLSDFLNLKGSVPEKAVVITFDDGWRSTLDLALPVLRKYGYPATLFLYTDLVGSTKKALTWKQVRQLDKTRVIDVQCHSKSHRNLKPRKDEDLKKYLSMLKEELIVSRRTLRRKIGKICRYLAYPYGASNHLVAAMAQKAGYRAAFSVSRGSIPFFVDNFRIGRSMIFGDYSLEQFRKNLISYSDRVLK